MKRSYTLELDWKMKEAILCALGNSAWECKDTPAYETYNETIREVRKQLKYQ